MSDEELLCSRKTARYLCSCCDCADTFKRLEKAQNERRRRRLAVDSGKEAIAHFGFDSTQSELPEQQIYQPSQLPKTTLNALNEAALRGARKLLSR